ncbi:hypothetical protein JCM6882_006207 [Rhodosporidiobolus microsporus]
MPSDPSPADEQLRGAGPSQGGPAANGRTIGEPERDATMTIPRRRAASPFGARQDTQRPFAFKRTSSGFSSYINYAASPTSDLRTRPSTPAESATRSTFGAAPALADSPPSTSAPFFSTSPSTTLAPLEIPSGPALQLTGPTPETAKPKDRPKGQGTLELERVLGMWAAKTPTTSSFPNLPPLSSSTSSTVPPSSEPLFTQTILASEPESFVPSFRSQPDSSSALFGDLVQGAPSFTASLAAPRDTPRRQRSRSEADIMRLDSLGLGTPAAPQPLPHDFDHRFLPSFTQSPAASAPMALDSSDVNRPPSAPSAFTTATPAFATLNLESEQHELTTRERPSLSRPRPSVGGPGYHEAALLEVPGYQRRARSQGAGHRRTAKSDDFTHLFTSGYGQQQQTSYEQPTTSVDGRLAPPLAGQAAPQVASPQPPPPPPAYPPTSVPLASPHLGGREPLVQGYLANGQPVLVPASYISPAPPPSAPLPSTSPSAPQGQYLAASAYPSHFPPPPLPPVSQAQAQAQAQGLQYYPYPAPSSHRGSVSSLVGGGSPSLPATHSPAGGSPGAPFNGAAQPSPPPTASSTTSAAHAMAAAAAYAALHPQRSPYVYHSPQPQPQSGLPPLPSPPVSTGLTTGASLGARSGRSSRGSVSAGGRTPAAPPLAGGDEGGDEDAEGEEDEEDEDEEIEEDDGSGEYAEGGADEDRKPRLLAAAAAAAAAASSSAPLSKAPKKKKAAAAAASTSPAEDFTKESKTTQATIDAAKRRRNVNAVAKFVCELCGETFTRRYNLRGHQRAHAGEKPYKCSYEGCDKSFARAHDCKRHELLHLGVRKYHCAPCKRDFVRLDALHRHHRSEVGQACVKQLQAEGYTFDEKGAVAL